MSMSEAATQTSANSDVDTKMDLQSTQNDTSLGTGTCATASDVASATSTATTSMDEPKPLEGQLQDRAEEPSITPAVIMADIKSEKAPEQAAEEPSANTTVAADHSAKARETNGVEAKLEEANAATAAPTENASTEPKKKRIRKPPAKKGKKPSKIIKLRLINKEPAPEFLKLEFEGSKECFWLRAQIREFLFRFDKLCRIPTRYVGNVNDITTCWTDPVYKAVIVTLFRLFSSEKTWSLPRAKQYLAQIESLNSSSAELWSTLMEFLLEKDAYAHNVEKFTGEHYRLELIRRLMVLTTSTDAIRITVINDHEQLQQLKKESAEQVKALQTQYSLQVEQLKLNKQSFGDKKVAAEKVTSEKIFRQEQTMYNRLRKYSLRTTAAGKDNFGNVYWILQQKGKEQWGNCVICEIKVFPVDEEQMVLEESSEKPESEPKEGEDKPEEPKRKRRRYQIKKRDFLSDQEPVLHYVTGQENLLVLAGWIRGQIGPKRESLATDLETMAYYCTD